MGFSLKNILLGGSIYTVEKFSVKFLGLLLIPIYTRVFNTAEYGIIGILESIFEILSIILILGFNGSQRLYIYEYEDEPKERGAFLFNCNVFIVTFAFIVCLCLSVFGRYFYSAYLNFKYVPYILINILIWSALLRTISTMILEYYSDTKQFKNYAIMDITKFILATAITLILILPFDQGMLGKFLGVLIGNIIFVSIFIWPYIKTFSFKINTNYIKKALGYGLPFVSHILSALLLKNIDMLMLKKYVSLSQIGIYALGYQVGLIISIAVMAFHKAWVPNFYELMKSKTKNKEFEFKRTCYV